MGSTVGTVRRALAVPRLAHLRQAFLPYSFHSGTVGRAHPLNWRFTMLIEWGISIGLIAATIFLFGLGARLMPVQPKEEVRAQV